MLSRAREKSRIIWNTGRNKVHILMGKPDPVCPQQQEDHVSLGGSHSRDRPINPVTPAKTAPVTPVSTNVSENFSFQC